MRVSGETINKHMQERLIGISNENSTSAKYLSIEPFVPEKTQFEGYPVSLSYGLTYAGYDVRLDKILPKNYQHRYDRRTNLMQDLASKYIDYSAIWGSPVHSYELQPGEFCIGSLVEYINVPNTMDAGLKDKSTLARLGLQVQNTVIEPGWHGYLTVEIINQSHVPIPLMHGMPIGQMQFTLLDIPVIKGYDGKYQGQDAYPIPAR